MPRARIAITLSRDLLSKLDCLVAEGVIPNRSRALEEAVADKVERITRERLARECAKLDPVSEQGFAEEGMAGELSGWPEY
ncbi:MAG: ribbon-helix-helix domain-containing protein [Candidatus Bipolaricaulota bacterium]